MPRTIISGEAGESYTNDTDKALFQWLVSWHNSCGLCIAHDHLIGPYWPIPIHRGCSCRQEIVYPGTTARPFVDFREKIATVSHAQQAAIMGRSNLALVESGTVAWTDVVTTGRIRSLREVASRNKLSVDAMVKGGVSPSIAREAWDAVHTDSHTASERRRDAAIAALMAKGYGRADILDAAGKAIANRLVVTLGPGPAKLGPPAPAPGPPSTPPATPAAITPTRMSAALKQFKGLLKGFLDALKSLGVTYRSPE